MKRIDETQAAKQLSAYIIVDKEGKLVGKVHVYYSISGLKTTVNAWDFDPNRDDTFMSASASGGGYDKLSACLDGMTFMGHTLADNGKNQISGLDYLREQGFYVYQAI